MSSDFIDVERWDPEQGRFVKSSPEEMMNNQRLQVQPYQRLFRSFSRTIGWMLLALIVVVLFSLLVGVAATYVGSSLLALVGAVLLASTGLFVVGRTRAMWEEAALEEQETQDE